MHPVLETAVANLLYAWRSHQENREQRCAIPELARSRMALEDARTEVHELRRRLAPTPDELAAAPLTTACDEYGIPVVVGHRELTINGGTATYRCACGTLETIELARLKDRPSARREASDRY